MLLLCIWKTVILLAYNISAYILVLAIPLNSSFIQTRNISPRLGVLKCLIILDPNILKIFLNFKRESLIYVRSYKQYAVSKIIIRDTDENNASNADFYQQSYHK